MKSGLSYRLNGVPLVLFRDTEAQMDFKPPITSDPLSDAFTTSFEVPVRGNEISLGHVHELFLRTRELELPGAEHFEDGVRVSLGSFTVTGSSPNAVQLEYAEDAFVSSMAKTNLRDAFLGSTGADPMIDHAKLVNTQMWPDASHCFPMIRNTAFYGSENPDWYSDIVDYDITDGYSVNNLVLAPANLELRHLYVYQCISAASAGEDPISHPAKWRLTAFGLINHWDHVNEEFFSNTSSGNFYTLVPMFYLKAVLTAAMENAGYSIEGEFMDDPDTHGLFIWNNVAIDKPLRSHYMLASSTAPVSYPGAVANQLLCQNDVTPPNSDVDDVWNTTTSEFTVPETGHYVARVHVRCTLAVADQLYLTCDKFSDEESFAYLGERTEWDYVFTVEADMSGGDVGDQCKFYARGFNVNSAITIHECSVSIWRSEDFNVNPFGDTITHSRHVPNETVADFLVAVRDTLCLKITPDRANKRVRFDYKRTILEGRGPGTDANSRLAGPIELDHGRKPRGLKLSYDADVGDVPNLDDLFFTGIFPDEESLPPSRFSGEYAVIANTRKVYVSRPHSNSLVGWFHQGYLLNPIELGDQDDAEEISLRLAPLMMDTVGVVGEFFLVPTIEEQGVSVFFATKDTDPSLRLCKYHGMQANSNGVLYPFASSYDLMHNGDNTIGNTSLEIDSEQGIYNTFWKAYALARVNGEPVLCDLRIDVPFLAGKQFHGVLHAKNQRFLVERLPVTFRTGESVRLANGVEMIRLKPPQE